jgi:MoaA/NifB/PqqE/SkfB family radical SAM enzyme|tara:strand:+ start:118 stop:1326 length:1209 start_codon:yes stop_codon:yes gene_type:complete
VKESKNKSNFCIRPFNSALITTTGNLKICCKIDTKLTKFKNFKESNIEKDTIEQWWISDYNNYVRQSFLENKKIKECARCWNQEKQGLASHRIKANHDHKAIFQNRYERNLKLIGKDALPYPEDVEIQITNLCNLKCQMCSGKYSSRLLVENNALGYEKLNQKDYDLNDENYEKIKNLVKHDIKLLNLIGGEPLFNKKIINLLSTLVLNNKASEMSLHITTNGTICNSKILYLLKHFKNVRLMLSIEGTGKHNEYMRYPSSWAEIKKNIKEFKTLNNIYLCINTVVQNLNILYINELIEYAHQNNIYINLYLIENPDYLDAFNLPKKILQGAYDKLKSISDDKLIHTKNVEEIISLLKERLNNHVVDEKKYTQFTEMIKSRDRYRNVHIKNYMPELAREVYK